jgi:hypothetical protein
MQIISHRGYWLQKPERNLPDAFHRSFDLGFGTETDVRDIAGQLVISHDMPTGGELTLDELLDIVDGRNLPLAINIKSDGLAQTLKKTFEQHGHRNWFAFDMTVPDMRNYLQADLPTYTRLSEVEPLPVWLAQAVGVWLDCFDDEWFSNEIVSDLLSQGKQVCVVSPELHGRDPQPLWRQLLDLRSQGHLMLCTDIPEDAVNFFK